MKVNIGVLKNELSKYLHKVKNGSEITITDRNEPIAKILPLERPLVQGAVKEWLGKHPPVKTAKKQPSAGKLLRDLRDEE